jgi:hypothetical protein
VSRQPVPVDDHRSRCVQSFPAVALDAQGSKRTPATDTSKSEPRSEIDPTEFAALRAFFELLSQWDQSLRGEIEHE